MDVKTVYFCSDNCGVQKKNYALLQYLCNLIKNRRFQRILHRYPEPGLSFLPYEISFAVVEKALQIV